MSSSSSFITSFLRRRVGGATEIAEPGVPKGTCPRCAAITVFGENAIPSCPSCGFVCMNYSDETPEWKPNRPDDRNQINRSRCGAPNNPLFESNQLACKMQWNPRGGEKAKRWNISVEPRSQRHDKLFYEACQYITCVAIKNGIPRVAVDRACWWYREMTYQRKFRGDAQDELKAGVVHVACREHGYPITVPDVSSMFNASRKGVGKCISLIEEFRITIIDEPSASSMGKKKRITRASGQSASTRVPTSTLHSVRASDFVERFCHSLFGPADRKYILLCIFITRKIEAYNYVPDNLPLAIAASVIFFVVHEFHITSVPKKKIALVTQISEVTINKCFKKLSALRSKLVPAII